MKDFLSIEEVAELTGYKVSYLYQLTSERVIPHYKPTGRKIFFLWAEVKEWLMSKRVTPMAELEREAVNLKSGK